MRRTITAAATAALTLGLVAGPAVAKPGFAGPGSDLTIVETAIDLSDGTADGDPVVGDVGFDSNGGDFDILVSAVVATGATAVLNGEADYTVFAPTDAAFMAAVGAGSEAEAFDRVVATFTGEDGVPSVLDVLSHHITQDWRPSPSVVNPKSITMLDGNTISVTRDLVITSANGPDGRIVIPDVKTADGGIHAISTVLIP